MKASRARRPALLLAPLLLAACSREAPQPAPARVIRAMHLDNQATSTIDFESVHARGRIEILPGVEIGYANTTVSSGSESSSRTRLTLREQPFSFDGPELRIGERSYGKLAGEVQVRIGPDGVFVGGEKRGEL